MILAEQLKRDEGFRSKPYLDTVGKTTIGYGRNLSDVGISQAEAEFLLENDINKATADLETRLPWTKELDEVRRAVLVNMSFNLGIWSLLGFHHFLAAVEAQDWSLAKDHMLASKWAQQVGPRAQRLATQMQTGTWQ